MRDITPKKYKHLLWKDELGESFLLTKHMEIFRYSDDVLGLYVWSRKYAPQIRKKWAIYEDAYLGDNFYYFRAKLAKLANLEDLIELGTAFKKRPHINGNWVESRAELLGHAIIPYRPELEEEVVNVLE